MMGIVKTQIYRVAGPVADVRTKNARPDRQVFLDVERSAISRQQDL